MAERISWILDARNQASGEFKNAEASLRSLDNTVQAGIKGLAGFAVAMAAIEVGRQVMELAQLGAQTERLRTSFDSLATSVGQSSDEMLAAMKRASGGAISNANLIQGANKAMLLGVADSSTKMAQLLDVAGARGKAMGRSMTEAFDDIVTGIGRMSPLILDNLGIVTGGQRVFDDYAASIGRSAASLTDAEKKQALFNAVIAPSAGMVAANAAAGEDNATSFERMSASTDNAKEALGRLIATPVAAFMDAVASSTNAAADAMDRLDQQINGASIPVQAQIAAFQELQAQTRTGSAEWIIYQKAINALTGGMAAASAGALEIAAALEQTGQAASDGEMDLAAFAAELDETQRASAAAQAGLVQARRELTNVGLEASLAREQLTTFVAELHRAQGAADSFALSVAKRGISGGVFNAEEAAAYNAQVKTALQLEDMRLTKQEGLVRGSAEYELAMEAARHRSGQVVDELIDANRETDRLAKGTGSVTKGLSDAQREAEQLFSNIKSAAQGVIQGALDPGVGVDPDKILEGMGLSEGRINENARRLADIAQNGLKGQDWLGDFAKTAPDIWKQIRVASNPQEEAARLLKDFQAGIRLDGLIDRDKAKQLVKDMILGGQNVAAMAQEIAQEISDEMGVSLQQATQATQQALGGAAGGGLMTGIAQDATTNATALEGPGAAAAQAFGGGFTAWFGANGWGAKVVTTLSAELKKEANLTAVGDLGRMVGATWGSGFLANVGENIPQALLDILVSKLGPLMQAQTQLNSQLTGAR